MKSRDWLKLAAYAAITLTFTSCGGAGDGSSGPSSGGNGGGGSDQVANGGIGGSGSGTVSGYGSIFVNGTREFTVEALSQLTLDDTSLDGINGGHDLPLGATVEFILGDDADSNLTSGTATAIRAFHSVVGPITSLSPLTVMGQEVTLEAGTQPNGTSLSGLNIGDVMEVAGSFDDNYDLVATRFAAANPSIWRMRARVRDITADGFHLGGNGTGTGLLVAASNATPRTNCDAFPSVGDKVLVRGAAGDNLADGLNVYDIECLPEGLSILQTLDTVPTDLPASYSGVITDGPLLPATDILLNDEAIIEIDGQPVRLTALTLNAATGTPLLTDTLNLLLPGALIDVDGTLGADGILNANRVRLLDDVVSLLEGILGGLVLNQPMLESPLERMAMQADANTDFDVSLLDLTLSEGEQINIVSVGPGRPADQILAALQLGKQAVIAATGEVEFERPLIALYD